MRLLIMSLFFSLFNVLVTAQEISTPYLGQKAPGLRPEVFAPGIISTKASEFGLAISPGATEFYFSRSLSVSVMAIMVVKYVNGEWTNAETVSFSGKNYDMDPSFSCDGKKIFFGSTRPNGNVNASGCDIWITEKSETGNWSNPYLACKKINTTGDDNFPCVACNGTLYFFSKKHKGFGGTDIFKSEFVDGKYSTPENLGEAINSRYNESDAYIAPDESYIIFNSERKNDSFGNGDLYISFRKDDGTWTDAINMGSEVNSKNIDYAPKVSPDGKYFFFSSYRKNNGNIYWMDAAIIDKLREEVFK